MYHAVYLSLFKDYIAIEYIGVQSVLHWVFFYFQHVLNLSFMEAAKGCNKDITARTQVICDRCDGKRAEPGTTYSTCSTCKGTGEVNCFSKICLIKCSKKCVRRDWSNQIHYNSMRHAPCMCMLY